MLLILLLLLVVGVAACDELPAPIERDLAEIAEDGELRVLFAYSPTGYFVYRGQPMGFEYDLLRRFAEERDLALRPVVARTREQLFRRLNEGEADVVAASLLAPAADSGDVAYTAPLRDTRPVLVQRTGAPAQLRRPQALEGTPAEEPDSGALSPVQVSARVISRPEQLAGETVHLPATFPLSERIVELSDSLTGEIVLVEVEDVVSIEPLIRRVARGEIRFTVSLEDVAQLQEEYYRNITIRPVLGARSQTVWAVRRNSPELLAALNDFIRQAHEDGTTDEVFTRYFEDREGFRERAESRYLTSETGQLSEYDDLLRQGSQEIGWDWRLLASQTYQESKFDPRARSWAGAMGLLQLMPATAREVNVAEPYDPRQNVDGAVRYLQWLTEQWSDIPDPQERLRFILASYNAGAGHVGDARRLAEKYGGDPNSWSHVAYWLLKKSERRYYTDPVVRYGFCRGLEPVTYVSLILERYDHYRNFVEG